MGTRTRQLVIVLALAGLGASAASTYVHYQLLTEPGYASFCDISQTVSCTQVYLSRYGSVWGVPVALGGVFWFGLVLFLVVAGSGARATTEFRQTLPTYLLHLATLGLAVAGYLAYASFFLLKTVCVLCVAVYVAVAGIFLLSGAGEAVPIRSVPGRAWRDLRSVVRRPAALAPVLVFMAAVAATAGWFATAEPADGTAEAAAPSRSEQSEFERWWEAQPRVEVKFSSGGARVLVVKFNDYQCPACAQTYFSYERIVAKYASSHPDQVRFLTADYPLDPECNAQAPNGPHQAACEAAVAVRLAERTGRRERMERWLFTNQETLSPERVAAAAREVAGVENFQAEYDRILQDVKADIALGTELVVDGTPTFVINGVMVRGGLAPQFFDAAIAYELARTGGS